MDRPAQRIVDELGAVVEHKAKPHPDKLNTRNHSAPQYLTRCELAARSRLSPTTIQRYKLKGLIPFYQPGGKGARVLFPPDAIEAATSAAASETSNDGEQVVNPELPGVCKSMPGRRPRWMSNPNNQESEQNNA